MKVWFEKDGVERMEQLHKGWILFWSSAAPGDKSGSQRD